MTDAAERGVALVTGAGKRIGRMLALAAAEAGYDLALHVRDAPDSLTEAAAVAAEVTGLGRQAVVVAADLAALADHDALATAMLAQAGALGPVTLLVNSASRFEDDRADSVTGAALTAHFAANLHGPVLLARAFAAALPAGREGLVVNLVDQRVWKLTPQFLSYTLSKAALWTATQTLAQALAPRIRVNAIGPGPTLRSVHQSEAEFAAEAAGVLLQRPSDPGQLAAALRYLIDARAVTGQMLAVDSGQHLGWRTPDIVAD